MMPSAPPPSSVWTVDASVIVKFVMPEEYSDRAFVLLDGALAGDWTLQGPDLWRTEVANAIWKRTRYRNIGGEVIREIGYAVAGDIFAWSTRLPVRTHASVGLLAAAFELAVETGATVYDSLYLALALRESTPLVTTDVRFMRRLDGHSFQDAVVHLGDL